MNTPKSGISRQELKKPLNSNEITEI
jgi:hypothetical protein